MSEGGGTPVRGLFLQAIDMPDAERGRFLAELLARDPGLHRALADLLESHDRVPGYLDVLGADLLPSLAGQMLVEPIRPGTVYGHYRIERSLGRGGMGSVYLAQDVELGRKVALKFLSSAFARDPVARDRLKQEARIASALDHPNIATVYEIGAIPELPAGGPAGQFIAMAYCGEHSLADELERTGALPLERALDYALQLVDALAAAHEAGVIHQDIKPGNLMLGERGRIKLVDFGVAWRAVAGSAPAQSTAGTLAYMSPEQVRGLPGDHRVDIWGVGVLLFEMLSGGKPFRGEGIAGLRTSICTAAPPRLADLDPSVPASVDALISRCLAKDPGARHASAAALLTELRSARAQCGAGRVASLAVLPFRSAAWGGETRYLAQGIAEDLIADLSQVRSLSVVAWASSRQIEVGETSLAEAAARLDVRYLLSGRVEVDAGALRVTASLFDSQSGVETFSTTQRATSEDILRMRQQLTQGVLTSLDLDVDLNLDLAEAYRASRPKQVDARAYEASLRARFEAWRLSAGGLERARRHIEDAIHAVGEDAQLLGTLGHITAMHAEIGLCQESAARQEVDRLVLRIRALEPRSVWADWMECWVALRRGDLRCAIRAGQHAHARDPDHPDVLLLLGYVYAHAGRNADSAALLGRALTLDPLTPLTRAVQGLVPLLEGRFAAAVAPYRTAAEMDPDSPFFATFHGWALAYAGETEAAVAVLHGVGSRVPELVFGSYARAFAYALEGRSAAALDAITPEFRHAARSNEMFARELAHCLALAGAHDEALDQVEQQIELGMWNHAFLSEHDRFLEGIRSTPRFGSLMQRVAELQAGLGA